MPITQAARRQAPTVTGSANQITVVASGVNYALSLPQNIHTAATPQFGGVGLGIAANALAYITTAASTAAKVSALLTPGVAFTGTLSNGMLWYEATNNRIKVVKNLVAVDLITSANNPTLSGVSAKRLVSANANGDLSGDTEIDNLFVTDSDIITAINSANFNTMKLAIISPANSKVIYQGQEYYNSTQNVYYRAIADNQVYILSGDVYVDTSGKKWRNSVSTSGVLSTSAV